MPNIAGNSLQVINASAGSGKTTRLVNQVLYILNSGVDPEKLTATTFTKKAAYEINSRLYRTIANSVLGKTNELLSEERAVKLIKAVTVDSKSPKIVTIDSFFSGAGKTFSFELGLPPDWRIVSEAESRELLEELCDELIQTDDQTKVGTLLRILKNDRAVRSVHSDLVNEIVAGIDLWRSVDVEDRMRVWNWEKKTYPRTKGMVELIEDLNRSELPKTAKEGKPDANYSKAQSKLSSLLEVENYREAIKVRLLGCVIDGSNNYYKKDIPQQLLSVLIDIKNFVSEKLYLDLFYKALAISELMMWFSEEYFQKIESSGSLSYDDLKYILSRGLDGNWSEVLAIRLDTMFDHLLFDEFQDTSLSQWEYFRRYSDEIRDNVGGGKSLFVVGDKKQSIYGWRGGVKELFDKVSNDIELSGGEIESIYTSYRSSPAVIELVNCVFNNLDKISLYKEYPKAIESWLSDFNPHEAHKKELVGEVSVIRSAPEEKLLNIAQSASRLAENPEIKDIGILVRSNRELRALSKIFDDQKISISQEGGAPLEEEALCVVLVSLLTLLDHPADTQAALIVSSSIVGDLLEYKNHLNSELTLDVISRVREKVENEGLFRTFSALLSPLREKLSERELTVLDEILELFLSKESQIGPRYSSINSLIRKHKFQRSRDEKIRLLTTHSAKGLEFDVVLLAELNNSMLGRDNGYLVERDDKLLPPTRVVRYENEYIRALFPELERIREKQKAVNLEEALSVLYVSLTRAKRGIILFLEDKSLNKSFQSCLEQTLEIPESADNTGSKSMVTIFGTPGAIFAD
jgi:ATP-dependent helicase/nuclease subunit A